MAFRILEGGGTEDIGPSESELHTKSVAEAFEALRLSHLKMVERVRSGELERNWETLKGLAITFPEFWLDQSAEYSSDRIAEKLAPYLATLVCKTKEAREWSKSLGPLAFSPVAGDRLFYKAALGWDPVERFQLEVLQVQSDLWKRMAEIRSLAQQDYIFFLGLKLALHLLFSDGRVPHDAALIWHEQLMKGEVEVPRKPTRIADPKTVKRRFAIRMFFHLVVSLGFQDVGKNRATKRSDTVADAIRLGMKQACWPNLPDSASILEDWNSWELKGT